MNIISNSCLGSDIYKYHLKIQYQNPFCWNTMDDDSLFKLISNYDSINFEKYELVKDKNFLCSIIIDKQVKVNYVHYHYSKDDKVLRKEKEEVYYDKIWDYVEERYKSRTNRFLKIKDTDKPIFLIGSSWNGQACREPTIERLSKIKTDYKIVFVINFDSKVKLPKNCIIYKHNIYHNNPKLAGELLDKVLKS